MEDAKKPCGVLLHVEDDGPLRATEARQGGRGGVQAETSVHSQLVSVCTTRCIYYIDVYLLLFYIKPCKGTEKRKSKVSLCFF